MTPDSTAIGHPPFSPPIDQEIVRPKVNLTSEEDEAFRVQARSAGLSYAMFLAALVRKGASLPETTAETGVVGGSTIATPDFRAAVAEFAQTLGKVLNERHADGFAPSEKEIRKIIRSEVVAAHNSKDYLEREFVWPMMLVMLEIGVAIGWFCHIMKS